MRGGTGRHVAQFWGRSARGNMSKRKLDFFSLLQVSTIITVYCGQSKLHQQPV